MKLFVHIFEHGDWDAILDEIRLSLIDAHFPAQDVVDSTAQNELQTLTLLHDYARFEHTQEPIGYVHLKGVTKQGEQRLCADDWRRYMSHFIIGGWPKCVQEIKHGHQLVGVNWHTQPFPHFSGNFWWGARSYLRTLKPPLSFGREFRHRSAAERWVGSGELPRVLNLHESHKNHYTERYPMEEYAPV